MNDFVLCVDKPEGATSFDVVKKVRKNYASLDTGRKRVPVGHTGTLDPFATGLLLILVGDRAVKCSECLLGQDKTYEATLVFGTKTSTGDRDGQILEHLPVPKGSLQGFQEHFDRFREKTYFQTPPMTSAKQINGQRLYRLARAGISVEREAVECKLLSLQALDWAPPKLVFRAKVQKGTFIRQLAEDFAQSIGTNAHLSALRRTEVGPFVLDAERGKQSLEQFFEIFEPHILSPTEWLGLKKGDPEIRNHLITTAYQGELRPLFFEGSLRGFIQNKDNAARLQPLFLY